jgi:hypothetical protein
MTGAPKACDRAAIDFGLPQRHESLSSRGACKSDHSSKLMLTEDLVTPDYELASSRLTEISLFETSMIDSPPRSHSHTDGAVVIEAPDLTRGGAAARTRDR